MNKVFRDQCYFIEEQTGLDLSLAIRLLRAAHQDKLALHSAIKNLGRYSEGRRKWLFKLVSATRNGYNLIAGELMS